MERATLELIAKLTNPNADEESIRLGQEIFLRSNPTSKDIETLNEIRGYAPIMFHYEKIKAEEVFIDHGNLFDILS